MNWGAGVQQAGLGLQSFLRDKAEKDYQIEQLRQQGIAAFEQGDLDNSLTTSQSMLFSRLKPVVSTPFLGTFNQNFINYTNTTLLSKGYAWVDTGANRLGEFALFRYNALGTQQVDIKCLVKLIRLPLGSFPPEVSNCVFTLNRTQLCQQFPSRCLPTIAALNAQYTVSTAPPCLLSANRPPL